MRGRWWQRQAMAWAGAFALVLAGGGACAAGGGTSAPAAPAAKPTWKETMRAVDSAFAIVDAELKRPGGDLQAVAHHARAAAALVRSGYGPLERKDVAGFARLALDCESWLLGIALEADQGHAAIARELLGRQERCDACHDRSGRRPR